MKALLVGEMPSRAGDRFYSFPLSGAVAQTLCQMAGVPPQTEGTRYGRWTWALYEAFGCVNALKRHQPWSSEVAAARLRSAVEDDREVVVLLGRRPQEAYALMTEPATSSVNALEFYKWVVDGNSPTGRRQVVVIPHPSSLNRTYNDPTERRRAGKILCEAMDKARELEETKL